MKNPKQQPLSLPHIISDSFLEWPIILKMFPLSFVLVLLFGIPNFIFPELNTTNHHIFFKIIEDHFIFIPLYGFVLFFGYAIMYHRIAGMMQKTGSFVESVVAPFKKILYLFLAWIIAYLSISIAYTLFFVPGLILSVLLTFYMALMMVDNEKPLHAFTHSCHLVWGFWWRTFGIFVVAIFVFSVFAFLIQITTHDIVGILHPRGGIIDVLHIMVRSVFTAVFLPWHIILVLMYFDDIKLRCGELSAAKPKPAKRKTKAAASA